jgi:hypothetical protein
MRQHAETTATGAVIEDCHALAHKGIARRCAQASALGDSKTTVQDGELEGAAQQRQSWQEEVRHHQGNCQAA